MFAENGNGSRTLQARQWLGEGEWPSTWPGGAWDAEIQGDTHFIIVWDAVADVIFYVLSFIWMSHVL